MVNELVKKCTGVFMDVRDRIMNSNYPFDRGEKQWGGTSWIMDQPQAIFSGMYTTLNLPQGE